MATKNKSDKPKEASTSILELGDTRPPVDADWAHHVTASGRPLQAAPSPQSRDTRTVGFRNPWPSWIKPSASQVWQSFLWGPDTDPCIQLAPKHLEGRSPQPPSSYHALPTFPDVSDWPNSPGAQAARLVSVEKPDFSFDSSVPSAKVTWLGHNGVLVQLAPLDGGSGRPIRCLFDPILSMRCSPNQSRGPIRAYPAPCTVPDLGTIDAVFISHNHYDHLDSDTLALLWRHNKDTIRFFVPLSNASWLRDVGVPDDRIREMDWWHSAVLRPSSTWSGHRSGPESGTLKVWCVPAQHNSVRSGPGGGANAALWSGWCLEHFRTPSSTSSSTEIGASPTTPEPYRVFFAGDTGYQFHSSPQWPPSPDNPDYVEPSDAQSPACLAFEQICARIGHPDLLLLPVSVGASFAYLRSFVPLPDWINPVPRHREGVTAANHMPPWDAVKVAKMMAGSRKGRKPAVAVALHWGTFVVEPTEVLKTLGQLEWACQRQGVRFAREVPEEEEVEGGLVFMAMNHGQSEYV